jgi:subtilisin family serine protease
MNRNVLIYFALLLPLSGALAQAGPSRVYTYLWQPHQVDVGKADDNSRKLLIAVLKLSKPTSYTVAEGDSIDFILRKLFYVSQGDFPNAYALYENRLWELNHDLNEKSTLHVGQIIVVPGGPQFSAIRLWKEDEKKSLSYFRTLSAQAFDSSSKTDSHLAPFVTRALGAFVNSAKSSSPTTYQKIANSGILRAIDLTVHPESELAQGQPINLYPTEENASLVSDVRNTDGEHMYVGLFPADSPVPVNCTGCSSCQSILNLAADTPLDGARVLIEDSGVDLGVLSGHNLQSMVIPQPLTTDFPTQASAQDLTSDHHGTFVYSQIVKPSTPADTALHGLLPGGQVFVMRVARTVGAGAGQQYSMSDILAGWKKLQEFISDPSNPINKGAAQTWIVNLSIFGEDTDSTDLTPAPPKSDRLLFVVAAGNNNDNTAAALYAFSRFTAAGNPVLSVGALGANGLRASYSNYHPQNVSVAERGDCVCGAPGQISGTSQAAPIVTTAAAVLASRFPNLKPEDIVWRLVSSAVRQPPANTSESFGGDLDLASALKSNVILSEDSGGAVRYHEATDITLPPDLGTEGANSELLRVSRAQNSLGSNRCFDLMNRYVMATKNVCPAGAAADLVYYTENGAQSSLSVNDVVDIILPISAWRDQSVGFPEIKTAN